MPIWGGTSAIGINGGGGQNNPDSFVGGSSPNAGMSRYRVIDLETGTIFMFHAMPTSIGRAKGVNWDQNDVIGRSSPVYAYRNSESQSVNLRIPLYSSIEMGDNRTVEDVKEACDFFMSLAYPDYTGGIIKPPHKVRFDAASQFSLIGVVRHVDIDYPGPWAPNGLSHTASVSLDIAEVEDVPSSFSDIRNPAQSGSSVQASQSQSQGVPFSRNSSSTKTSGGSGGGTSGVPFGR